MIFLVVDNNNYDLLLGLNNLMKIGVIVVVEKRMIHVQNCLGVAMEIIPLNVVNMFQMVAKLEEACFNIFNNISLEHLHEEGAKACPKLLVLKIAIMILYLKKILMNQKMRHMIIMEGFC
jgi:hypothetical protein